MSAVVVVATDGVAVVDVEDAGGTVDDVVVAQPIDKTQPADLCQLPVAGTMFWFTWKMFPGS